MQIRAGKYANIIDFYEINIIGTKKTLSKKSSGQTEGF